MDPFPVSSFPGRAAAKIALAYLLAGILWIVFSDQAVLLLFNDPATLTRAQNYKGWFFVAASALLIFFLLRREIAHYHQSRQSLEKNEQYLRSLVRIAPTGIGVVRNRQIVSVNERICAMTGYRQQELVGQNARILYPSETEYQCVGDEKYRQIDAHGSGTVETRWRREDGRIIDVLLSSTPLDPANLDQGVTFTALDITAAKRAEESIRASEERYRELINLAVDGILLGSHEGIIIEANNQMCQMLGMQHEDFLGRHISQLPFKPESIHQEPFRFDLLQEGQTVVRQRSLLRPDGQEIIFEMRTKMMPDGSYQSIYRDITEQKRAEDALRESERKFALAFTASPDSVNINRLSDGQYYTINPGFTRLTGYSPEDVQGKSSLDINIWTDPADRQRLVAQLTQSGACDNLEAVFRRKDGSHGTGLMSARVIDINGQPHILSITRDISQLKKAEQEIRAQQLLFATMFNTISDAIIITDCQRQIQMVNASTPQLFGYAEQELIGQSTAMLYSSAQDYIAFGETLYSESSEKNHALLITMYRDNQGRIFPGETFGARLLDSSGAWIGNIGVIRDITARLQNEADLHQLRVAIEHAAEMVVITDVKGLIQYANPAFTAVTGYTLAEVLQQNPRLLQSGQHDRQFYRQLWKTIGGGHSWSGRFINKRKDGSLYTEEATISPIFNNEGKISNYVAIKRDITAHLKLEAQYLQAQKMESVGRLTGGVAHDFNNILAIIIGYTEIAMEEVAAASPLHADLEKILEAAHRSADIVRQLLAFSRKQSIAPKVLDLNAVVEGMLNMLRRLIGEDIDLAWLPAGKLPAVVMDPAQINQILANLCVNARDAIAGTGKITIETATVSIDDAYCQNTIDFLPGEYVLLTVSDNGCGMEQDLLATIFEPFFTTKGFQGTGLGLATVYGIVKQNQGFINVYSEPGKGTSFKLYLPSHGGQAVTALPDENAPVRAGKGETVLLVEDDRSILEMASAMLSKLGYQVLSSTSPQEALTMLAKAQAGPVDLLLTDVVMPEINGKELAERLLQRLPQLRVVFMSGYTANVIAHHGVLDSGVNFLQKPFSLRTLAAKIGEALDQPTTISQQ